MLCVNPLCSRSVSRLNKKIQEKTTWTASSKSVNNKLLLSGAMSPLWILVWWPNPMRSLGNSYTEIVEMLAVFKRPQLRGRRHKPISRPPACSWAIHADTPSLYIKASKTSSQKKLSSGGWHNKWSNGGLPNELVIRLPTARRQISQDKRVTKRCITKFYV